MFPQPPELQPTAAAPSGAAARRLATCDDLGPRGANPGVWDAQPERQPGLCGEGNAVGKRVHA